MSDIESVKQRVQSYLTSEGPVNIDAQGRYSLAVGSTRVFVEVADYSNGEMSVVKVVAPILFNVPITPSLYEYVALHADDWTFGSLGLWPDGDDLQQGSLMMRHSLLGDYLDKDELLYAVYGVGSVADNLDDDLATRFGGVRFEDS